MSLTVQNLRAVGTGVEPASLLPGQICFNITDKVLYVGDGSSFKTDFEGNQVPGVPGEGWYAMPMDFASLGSYYVANPEVYGDVPTDQQVLTWSDALNHPIWTTGSGAGGNQVYVVTNAAVASASGATTSDKITSAIGVASPDEGDVTIVTGLPDDVYEGLYFFTTSWIKGAAYAYPSASEVIYNNTGRTIGATVQAAIDDLDDGLIATTAIANTANSTANSALSIASAALPRSGGTMTGVLTSVNINVQSGHSIAFNGGVNGNLDGINDSISLTSSTVAASGTAVKTAYDIGAAALPRTGGTMTGTITFAAGQLFPISGIDIASTSQLGVVQVGTNINVTGGGTISVNSASTTIPGVVQLNDTTASTSTTQALTANQGYNLQTQINNLSLASNVTLGGSFDCSVGHIDSTTSAGQAAGLVVNNNLPAPALAFNDIYVVVTVAGSYSPPGGGGPYNAEIGDWFLCGETAPLSGIYVWQYLGVGARPAYATTGTAGIVQLSDNAQTQSGVSGTLAVTPLSLQSKLSDSTSTVSSTTIASSTAVKSAYDLANAALPKAGGTMTGDLTFSGASVGVIFNDASNLRAISDSVATTSSTTAASSTAVKSAYDLGFAALPKAGGTMTGTITFAVGQIFPVSGIQDATTGQKGVVQIGTNIDVASGTISVKTATTAQLGLVQVGSNIDVSSGTISVKSASTTQAGIVQLNDTAASTSTTQALTANQGYQLQQQINALSTSNNVTFAGTFNAATSQMVTVTLEGASVGFAVGAGLPAASTTVAEYFVIVSTAGTTTPPGGSPTATNVGDWFLASSTSWTYIAAGYLPPAASTTTPGIIQLATNAQTQAGANSTNAVVPSALQSKMSDSTSTTSSTTIASSTAVKSAYDLANAAVPRSCYTALGALAAGTGAGTVGTLSSGTNGQFLSVNTACASGLQWCTLSLACVPCSAFTAAGQLLAGTGASTFTALNPGTNGQFLVANSACTSGLQWVTECFVNDATYTAKGDIVAGTGAGTYSALPVGTNGQVLVPNSSCATGLEWITTGALCFQGYTCTATPFNTAFGAQAGDSITSGLNNTSIGYAAGTAITTGSSNTMVGSFTGCAIVGGNNNTIVGCGAARSLSAGGSNTVLGTEALFQSNSSQNVAIGRCALAATATTGNTVAVGFQALTGLTSGSQNTAVGFNSGLLLTTGGNNTMFGYSAGSANISGTDNTFIGESSGLLTTGSFNVFLGGISGCGVTTGTCSVAIGYDALNSTFTGTQVVAIGRSAGTALTTGSCSTLVGHNAGAGSTTSCNTAIGWCALATNTTGSFNTVVGVGAGQQGAAPASIVAIGHTAGQSVNNTGTIAIGRAALQNATTGVNTAVGYFALQQHITAGSSTAVGFQAGCAATGGGHTLIGNNSGSAITTGTNNTIVGPYTGTTTLTNNVVLADGSANIRFQANSSGAISFDGTNFGTAGQILQSNGNAAVPTWVTSWQNVTTTLTTTSTTTLLSLPVATTRSVQLFLTVSNTTTGRYHSDTYQIITDGTTANSQLTGGASIGAGAYTWSVSVSAGNLLLQVTPQAASSTKFVAQYFVTPV